MGLEGHNMAANT